MSLSVEIASPWDRAVIVRLGGLRALQGPEKTLTKDTVPVDVDAVLFWKVIDPEKAALVVADYTSAIS